MLRCRKGDLAIVIHGSKSGRICEVSEYLGTTSIEISGQDHVFSDIWKISYHGESHDPIDGCGWACRDSWLIPISPGDMKELEETEKEFDLEDQ